jgi:hypothetical protein
MTVFFRGLWRNLELMYSTSMLLLRYDDDINEELSTPNRSVRIVPYGLIQPELCDRIHEELLFLSSQS